MLIENCSFVHLTVFILGFKCRFVVLALFLTLFNPVQIVCDFTSVWNVVKVTVICYRVEMFWRSAHSCWPSEPGWSFYNILDLTLPFKSPSHFHLSVSPPVNLHRFWNVSKTDYACSSFKKDKRLWSISEAFCGLGKTLNCFFFFLCISFNNQKHVAVSLGEDVVRGNFCQIPWGRRTLAVECKLLSKVSHFSKISYKNQKLAEQKGRKKRVDTVEDRRQHLIQMSLILSAKQKPTFLRNKCTLLMDDFYYCTRSWTIYMFGYLRHFATRTYLIKPGHVNK